jgi:hypothetical protein
VRLCPSVAPVLVLLAASLAGGGCQVMGMVAAVSGQLERAKKIEVLAEYEGLRHRSVAVVVQSDLSLLYEHPTVAPNVAANLAARISAEVEGARVLDPRAVLQWQWQTPNWTSLPYGQIAEELGVERVVVVDIHEYRLHPPGNSWLWDGVAGATVGIIERGGFEVDEFAQTYSVFEKFPDMEGVARDSANARQIETGLLTKFIQRVAWLFYDHLEDKYPR